MEGPKLSEYHITTVENPNDLKASLIYGNIIAVSYTHLTLPTKA